MIRRGDVVVVMVALALVVGLALHVHTDGTPLAVRITAGNDGRDFAAWHSRRITVHGPLGETVVEIDAGRVRVVASPCTRKLCMRGGWLNDAGDATACVPNRVSLLLLGDDPRFDALNF